MLAVQNYKDYMQAAPVTFILTDSQPLCWAMRHKDDNLKLSRWILKLWEFNPPSTNGTFSSSKKIKFSPIFKV
jgi:hypothetical protein